MAEYSYISCAKIRPQGWLGRQLRLQADGLSGNLDKVWPDVRDSKWIGGGRDGWERVPYWLDGFIPLAWLLDDGDLKSRAKRYIDAILAGQKEDGWICPCEDADRGGYDVWAAFLILKVLVEWHECTGDDRVEDAVYRALKQLDGFIMSHPIFGWARARWFECLIPLKWLYDRRPEEWMSDMAVHLDTYGLDYEKLWNGSDMSRKEEHFWYFHNHVVNTGMAIKCRAEMSEFTGEDPCAFADMMNYSLRVLHGSASGHFTGDECLAGPSPIQGSELCSVVEAMYSYEELLRISGDAFWGDRLEETAYNALPATISADMWSHQYDQMSNQIRCEKIENGKQPFTSNSGEAHMFGLEPNYGCCTANFNQGWPKFARSAVMKTPSGFAVCAYAPVKVTAPLGKSIFTVGIDTDYPFKDTVRITVNVDKPRRMTLKLRYPGFADGMKIKTPDKTIEVSEDKLERFVNVTRVWNDGDKVTVDFDFDTHLEECPSGLTALYRGALCFSVPVKAEYTKVEYERDGVERKFPYCDWSIAPKSDWAYGFASTDFKVTRSKVPDMPFDRDNPPLKIETLMAPLDWKEENGVCREYPESDDPAGEPVKVKLVPYGCTTLRMTEMPDLNKYEDSMPDEFEGLPF